MITKNNPYITNCSKSEENLFKMEIAIKSHKIIRNRIARYKNILSVKYAFVNDLATN